MLREVNLPILKLRRNLQGEIDWTEARSRWISAWDMDRGARDFLREYRDVFDRVESMVTDVSGDRRLFTQRLLNRLMFHHFLSTLGNARMLDENPVLQRLSGCLPDLNGGMVVQAVDDACGEDVDDAASDLVLDGLFARWNFTAAENTPLDVEVAVDPQMLGKVFEETVAGRHESGSYYTPRPVVSFMCREALKGYLGESKIPGEDRRESPEALSRFVDEHDAAGLIDPEPICKRLQQIRVCDPACGSGAFLLGMLHELAALRRCLFRTARVDPGADSHRKLEIIRNNLYGVDSDEFAVNTTRQRLWLSVAAEQTADLSDPPPGGRFETVLCFNIECGDSLLAPDPAGAAAGFDWRLRFPEVFDKAGTEEDGFDIVLMNPPYFAANRAPGDRREELRSYLRRLSRGKSETCRCAGSDLYVHFLYRALDLLKEGGQLYAITPGTYLTNSAKEHLRRRLLERDLRLIMPLGPDVFSAVVHPCILGVRNAPAPPGAPPVRFIDFRRASVDDIDSNAILSERALSIPATQYGESLNAIFFRPTEANRALFTRLLSARQIVEVGRRRYAPLEMVAPALDTGIDSGNVRQKLFYRESPVDRRLPRLLQGAQVVRYGVWWANPAARFRYVDITYQPDWRNPGIGRGGKASARGEYWSFRGPAENHRVPERILLRQTEDEPYAGYLRQGCEPVYTDNTIHTMLLAPAGKDLDLTYPYLLAILNSSTLRHIYQQVAQEEGRTLAQVKISLFNRMPIPLPSANEQSCLESLVSDIQAEYKTAGFPLSGSSKARVTAIRDKIDEQVASFYRL